jgi:NAD-dependent SIR2 family protein deacetylase
MNNAGEEREGVLNKLASSGFMSPDDERFWHGRAFDGTHVPPVCTWKCNKPPRDDHKSQSWLTASEYVDDERMMVEKAKQLARLMRMSTKTVLYTGAGISASAVGQAARSGSNKVGWKANPRQAKPTLTHKALGLLGRHRLVHSWVQQNHDGLPQKAGFPQECINEIHGSWYDCSNPVVKYSGSLHERAYPWMVHDAETADLVIVLGSSLGGLNADQVATNAAKRSRSGASLGTVCINLQQTPQDGKMSLRLFGKSDMIMQQLLVELGLKDSLTSMSGFWPRQSRVLVPYDKSGLKLDNEKADWMWLDLSDGQLLRLTPGHNCRGSEQPAFRHIGAPPTQGAEAGARGGASGSAKRLGPGNGRVIRREEASSSFSLEIEGATMSLGLWWLDVASRGAVPQLPVVNRKPTFERPVPIKSSQKPTKAAESPDV